MSGKIFNPYRTRALRIGRLRLATWGGKGYIMGTRGFAISWNGKKNLFSVETYWEGRS